MNSLAHPSTFIEADWYKTIRGSAKEAEEMGMLHPQQLELIYQHKWFKALLPVEYGGLDLSLPSLVRLQEALSWADGSFGWVFTYAAAQAGFRDL